MAVRPDAGADLELSMINQKIVDSSPLTLALSPRGKRVKLENQFRGRGDNRKTIHCVIFDRVKYTNRSRASFRVSRIRRSSYSDTLP